MVGASTRQSREFYRKRETHHGTIDKILGESLLPTQTPAKPVKSTPGFKHINVQAVIKEVNHLSAT